MTCENIQEQYLDYMEGSLDPVAMSEFESHLSLCSTCARDLTMLRWTAQTLRALPAAAPPADLRLRVRMQLLPEPVAPTEPFYQRWLDWLRPRRWAMPVALATGVVAMLLFAVALPSIRNKQSAEQSSPPATASAPDSFHTAMKGAPPVAQSNAEGSPLVQIDVIPGSPKANYAPRNVSPQGSPALPPPGAGGYRPAPPNVNRFYPRQAQPSPYSNDIKEPKIKRSEHGIRVDQHPPSNPPVPLNNNVYRDPRLAMNQPQPHQPQKTSRSEGERSTGDIKARQEGESPQSSTTDSSSAGPSHSDVAPEASPVKPPLPLAKGEGDDKGAMRESSNKSPTEQAITPQKPVTTDSGPHAPKGASSVLKSSPILTLYLNRPQQITLHIQPTTDLAQAEVLVTLPPMIDLRGVTRLGLLPHRVYSGPIFSNQPVPITLDLLPRSPGRYVINVTLRSPSLSRPITQRIQVQVQIPTRMGQ